jgi:hypothetical protein
MGGGDPLNIVKVIHINLLVHLLPGDEGREDAAEEQEEPDRATRQPTPAPAMFLALAARGRPHRCRACGFGELEQNFAQLSILEGYWRGILGIF